MHLRFTFRSDFHDIPEPNELFEFTRVILKNFENAPYKTYCIIERNICPMGQLINGLYFSFKDSPKSVADKLDKVNKDDEAKLEMTWVLPGMVRIEVSNRGRWLAPKE